MIKGWYINLERRSQRRLEMEQQLDALGLSADYQRFAAIDGKSLSLPTETHLSAGEVGCWLSHFRVLQQADGECHVHVLEDDAVLHPRVYAVLELFLQQHACEQWDILYTDMVVPHEVGNFKYLHNLMSLYRRDQQVRFLEINQVNYAAATSYLVNRDSLARLVQLLDQGWTGNTPYDLKLRKLANQGQLKAWVCFPFFSTLADSSDDSSIKAENLSWQPFDLFRRSFYVDAPLKDVLLRFAESSMHDDLHVQIYLRLLETIIDPEFKTF